METAKDNLLYTKISQAVQANKHRVDKFPFRVGERILLSTENRLKEQQRLTGTKIASKLVPRFEGPYEVAKVDERHSTVTLNIPGQADDKCRVFHISLS